MANSTTCILWVLRQEDATLEGRVVTLADGAGLTRFGITSAVKPPADFYTKPAVNALQDAWNGGAIKSGCHKDGQWSGTIDKRLARWLGRVHGFFQWWRDSHPKRRDVALNLFRYLDPSGLPLPEPLEKQRADRWLELHNYFVRTAHRAPTTSEDFETRLEALEQLLLDSLFRQPSEDLSVIDAILKEARNA